MPDLFTLTAVLSLVIAANVAARLNDPRTTTLFTWLLRLLNIPIFIIGVVFVITPAAQLQALQVGSPLALANPALYGYTMQGIAMWGLLATVRSLRRALAQRIPLDAESPVHTLALMLAGYLVGNVAIILTQGGLDQLAETADAAALWEVAAQQLLFVVVALLGVGLVIRRNGRSLLQRLGLERMTGAQLRLGLRWIVILVALQWLVGVVWGLLDPAAAEQLGGINETLLADFDTWWEWLVLAIAAGVGEEILFRGALQPVFGLPATAVLFAIGHVQYGLTPITGLILVIGLALGLIRRSTNTTVAIFVHAGYNFVLGMIALLVA